MIDLFILAAEASADLQGAKLVEELLKLRPDLKIAAMSGPKMRKLPIQTLFKMESLEVMGFLDVIFALPKIVKQFFDIRKKILKLNPKIVLCIDYPGFNLRLQSSLRKNGFKGKLIHYICPTVWAWGKKRIPLMAKNLDLLMTLFPFENNCFANTSLRVEYVGHPLTSAISNRKNAVHSNLLALFPGSREKEIERNLPLQLEVAKQLLKEDPTLEVAVSIAQKERELQIKKFENSIPIQFISPEKNYELMQRARLALATSGTVTLELALHKTPSIVNYAIRPLDVFLAQKIFKISLPHYCIVNIIASKEIFPEFFGPNLKLKNLLECARTLWFSEEKRSFCKEGCEEVRESLGNFRASEQAALHVCEFLKN